MEILIRLAGVQLGPYSEAQTRQHIVDGLLSLTDLAKVDGSEEWASLAEVLAKVTRESRVLPRMELAAATVPLPGRRGNETDAPTPEPGPKSDPKPKPESAPAAVAKPKAEPAAAKETKPTAAPAVEPPSKVEPDSSRRAPTTPPGVSHLPRRIVEEKEPDITPVTKPTPVPDEAPVALERKTILLGPTAPGAPLVLPPSPSSNTLSTSPLVGTVQKKTSRAALVKSLGNKTSPLPTTAVTTPWRPPPAAPEEAPTTPLPRHTEAKEDFAKRSLQAKTVPMHAKASPPPGMSAIATTTPMATRAVGKPTTPPKLNDPPSPAPGESGAKKRDRMLLPDSGPIAPPTPLSKEDQKKLDLLKKNEAEMAREDGEDPTSSKRPPRRFLPLVLCLTAVLAVAVPYYVWSPYHAASQLRSTLASGDPADLNAMIDFNSVRALLRDQIQVELGAQDSAIVSKVLPMLNNSIDHYVTAEGISALVTKSHQAAATDDIIAPDVAAKLLNALQLEPTRSQGLTSLVDFAMDRDVAMLHLRYRFLGWTLKRVDLAVPALSAAAGTTSPLLTPVVATYLSRGDAMAKKNQWSEAATEYTRVLSIDPRSSAAYNARGQALQAKGNLDGAIDDYSQALTIDPQSATAYNNRGNARYAKNDQDGAITDYTQAIRIDPMLATAYDSRGNSKASKNDFEGAIADYTQAITIDPGRAQPYSDRGFARQANNNPDGAIADYTAALAINPKSDIAYYNRGLARQMQGNLDAAITDFDHALAFNPKIAGAYYFRGKAKSASRDLDGAIADYTKALSLSPNLVQAYTNRGLARREKGDLDAAKADFTSALGLDPKQASAYFNRAQIKAQKKDLDGAIADSTQALDLEPKNAAAFYTRGFAKLAKGNLDGAATDLKQFCGLSSRERDADRARVYLWLIAKAQGARSDGDPDQDLSQALQSSWNSTPDDIVTKTANYLLGRLPEPDYLSGAASADAKSDQSQHCQAWYFAGVKRMLTGDKAGAMDAFRKSIATGLTDSTEHLLATEELAGLEAVSAQAPAPVSPPPPATP